MSKAFAPNTGNAAALPPLPKKVLQQLQRDALDLTSAAARKQLTLPAYDEREARAARDNFTLGCWLHYYSKRVGAPDGLADRIDCAARLFESGIGNPGYQFFTVFDFGSRQFDTIFEMGDGDQVVYALYGMADGEMHRNGFSRIKETLERLGMKRPVNLTFTPGEKVFIRSEKRLATVLGVYPGHEDIRLDVSGMTHPIDIEKYDAVKHAPFEHTYREIPQAWKDDYGIAHTEPEIGLSSEVSVMGNSKVGACFDAVVEELGENRLSYLLLNWNDSEFDQVNNKLYRHLRREDTKIGVGKREFLSWVVGQEPFDPKVYGADIRRDQEWCDAITQAREAIREVLHPTDAPVDPATPTPY